MKLTERAWQLWPLLAHAAKHRQTLVYSDLAKLTGYLAPGMGSILAVLMRYCAHRGLPPLTVLVVNKNTGRPGEGLLTSAAHDQDRERVYEFDWLSLKPPTPDELATFAQEVEPSDTIN